MFSRKFAKDAMKVIRNAIRHYNQTLVKENCPVKLEIYKWNMKSGSALVIGYRTDRPKPELCNMAMDWIYPSIFMHWNLNDIVATAYNQC